MTQKIKKSIAAISAVATVLTSLLYFQGNILANAEEFDSNGFASDGTYQKAVLTTDKYDIDNNGKFDDVYEISNAGQLYWFANEVGDYGKQNAVLTSDITVNTGDIADCDGNNYSNWREWALISKYGYSGIFDGQGHTISGLYYKGSDEGLGLFGYLNGGKILNVGVENSYFYSDHDWAYVGGICGNVYSGEITNCYNKGTVSASISSNGSSGGICGNINDSCNIKNCFNSGSVNGSNVGAICGNKGNGNIENCFYLENCLGSFSNISCEEGKETTSEKFASGEIAYLLQNEQNENIWGQEL